MFLIRYLDVNYSLQVFTWVNGLLLLHLTSLSVQDGTLSGNLLNVFHIVESNKAFVPFVRLFSQPIRHPTSFLIVLRMSATSTNFLHQILWITFATVFVLLLKLCLAGLYKFLMILSHLCPYFLLWLMIGPYNFNLSYVLFSFCRLEPSDYKFLCNYLLFLKTMVAICITFSMENLHT